METSLIGLRVAILVMDGFEHLELSETRRVMEAAGANVHVVSPEGDWARGWNERDWWASGVDVDVELMDADPLDYDALLLPGGIHSVDRMRSRASVVRFVRHFIERHKPVAAMCRSPWVLIEARGVEGRRVTSHPSIRTDLSNAGAQWVDAAAVVDQDIVTGRTLRDLPRFIELLTLTLSETYWPSGDPLKRSIDELAPEE